MTANPIYRNLCILFLVAICVKSAYLATTEPGGRDAWELGRIAGYIAEGRGFCSPFDSEQADPCIHFAPGIPAYLAGLQVITGSVEGRQASAAWINVVLSALTSVMLFVLGSRLFNRQTGWVAAWLFVFCPASWLFLASSWSATVLALSGTLWLYLADRLRQRPTLGGAAMMGAATAVLALIDTPFLLAAPVAILAALLPAGRSLRWVLSGCVVSLLAFLVITTPWLIRCWNVTDGHVIPIRGNFGMELWVGNHPGAGIDDRTFHPYSDPPETALADEMGELQYNRHCLDRAKSWINENPVRFRQRVFHRFTKYWLGSAILEPGDTVVRIFKITLQGIPLVLAILGIGLAIRDRRPVILLVACLFLLPLPHYVTHSGWIRYRLPLDPIIYLFAANALVPVMGKLFKKRDH